jgi:hypothetical protein
MTLPSLATIEQLNARLVEPVDTDPDDPRAVAALEDASAEVRHAAGRSWTVEESGGDYELEDVPDIAVRITLRLAKDIVENPYGYRSEQVGEYAYQRAAGGGLTPEERAALDELSGDIVSVPTVSSLKVSGRSAQILDEAMRDEAGWL